MRRSPFLALFILLSACETREQPKKPPAELYEVQSHEASSGDWIILRVNNDEHTKVQITAQCDFYKWVEHEPVKGPNSCDLVVGQRLIQNGMKTRPGEFLDVWQTGDTLFITRGEGAERVHQQFSVRSSKVIQ